MCDPGFCNQTHSSQVENLEFMRQGAWMVRKTPAAAVAAGEPRRWAGGGWEGQRQRPVLSCRVRGSHITAPSCLEQSHGLILGTVSGCGVENHVLEVIWQSQEPV